MANAHVALCENDFKAIKSQKEPKFNKRSAETQSPKEIYKGQIVDAGMACRPRKRIPLLYNVW